MREWSSPFIKGFSMCFTICGVIGTVAIYFNNTILCLKDENILRLENEITKQVDFSERYHEEQVMRRQVELRSADLKENLSILISKNWEEKYFSEHLAKQTLEKKVELLKVRNEGLENSINSNKKDPKKSQEINYIKQELKLAKQELSQLRILYTQEKDKKFKLINVPISSKTSDESVFEMVKASISNLGSSNSRDFLISTYKGTEHKITITQLSQVVYRMRSLNTLETIQAISKNIVNDQNPTTLKKILSRMGSSNSAKALKYFVK